MATYLNDNIFININMYFFKKTCWHSKKRRKSNLGLSDVDFILFPFLSCLKSVSQNLLPKILRADKSKLLAKRGWV